MLPLCVGDLDRAEDLDGETEVVMLRVSVVDLVMLFDAVDERLDIKDRVDDTE